MKKIALPLMIVLVLAGCATTETYTLEQKFADAKAIATLSLIALGSTPEEAEQEVADFVDEYREEITRIQSVIALTELIQTLIEREYGVPTPELEPLLE